jgi:hypothetical protein
MGGTARRSIDAEEFAELSQPIVGLPIAHAWRGHGSALFLELGRLHRVDLTRLVRRQKQSGNPKGEAGVMIEWSWRIERVVHVVRMLHAERRWH